MNWLALLGALAKLLSAIATAFREHRLIAAGEASGRAASDADHARSAAARAAKMQEIAAKPVTRQNLDKRLEEGSA